MIGATYAGWRHELILSGYQAVVLLLFNQADALSLSELRRMSALPDKELGTVCAFWALWISVRCGGGQSYGRQSMADRGSNHAFSSHQK